MTTATAVRERPVIFSGEMVRAILEGRKTATRRVVKPQPAGGIRQSPFAQSGLEDGHGRPLRPRYFPGDHLWVRETWAPIDDREFGLEQWVDYRATPRWPDDSVRRAAGWDNAPDDAEAIRWRSPIYMPRSASRLTLEVTYVRVERLQDLDPEDVPREGISLPRCGCEVCARSAVMCPADGSQHLNEFRSLWDSLNEKRGWGWETNPWCWVIVFRKLQP